MTCNDFPVPQPSATQAVRGTQNLQRLLHVAIRNTAAITGRHPAIVPISKDSPFYAYANHDLEISRWEDPWHIVEEISRSHADVVTSRSDSVLRGTVSRRNGLGAEGGDIEESRAGIQKLVNNTDFDLQQKNNFCVRNVGLEGRKRNADSHIEPIAREASVRGEYQGSHHDTKVTAEQTSWIPRIFQGRKLFMRVFPYEIQSIMHAFGEVRFCSADVLEFMEDAVRNITQRAALGVLTRFNTDKLTVREISTCIRHDPRALHRLLFCLLRARQKGDDLHVVRPTHREWDAFLHHSTIRGMMIGEFPSMRQLGQVPMVKIQNNCNEKAISLFYAMLGNLFRVQHAQCIQSYVTDRYSRCPTEGVGGRRRIDLFREWLALPGHVEVTEGSLHALGNLTREAVGIITQTALFLKYRNGLYYSYERQLIDAIGFGIGAGVLVPLSSLQTYELLRILDEMELAVKAEGKWSFRASHQEEALEMKHVREAWRQLDDPDALAAHKPFWVGL